MYLLYHLKRSGVPVEDLLTVYKAMIRPILEYACPVWHSSLTDKLSNTLEWVQKRAFRTILGQGFQSYSEKLEHSRLPSPAERREEICEKKNYDSMKDPHHRLHHLLPAQRKSLMAFHRGRLAPIMRTTRFAKSFVPWSVWKFN